ncbi:hypothetical protein KIPB_002847 [Kipferlia bialata]|uniref:Uncharacterized protein n=1 Tax=Kipferlia bialata TaxID=797122 RepID=A0A391NMN3_9EUKA|nr:hypothetical protein KIPB_002847 [Kipferlia bialata]|eukprot:g2847.t1
MLGQGILTVVTWHRNQAELYGRGLSPKLLIEACILVLAEMLYCTTYLCFFSLESTARESVLFDAVVLTGLESCLVIFGVHFVRTVAKAEITIESALLSGL